MENNSLPLATHTLLLSVQAFNATLAQPNHTHREYARAATAADYLELELAYRAAGGDLLAKEYLGEA